MALKSLGGSSWLCAIVTGGIETDALPWLPHSVEGHALETHPGELFSRQIERFLDAVRGWIAAGDTIWLVASGAWQARLL